MTTSVIVLSYDRPALLAQALASIAAQRPAPHEVIVVDNPSPRSGEVAALVAAHPRVRLLRPHDNLGFTGGMNAGLAVATGAYVFLTEDDLLVEPGAIAALAQHLERRASCALCGGVMLDQETGAVRSAGMRISLAGVYRQRVLAAGPAGADSGEPYPVDALPGAGLFARTWQLRELGGFRDDFFMYYEDVELCARIRRRGWSVEVVPAARVRHFTPPPGPAPARLEYHKMKNLAATYVLHARGYVLPEFALRYALLTPLRALFTSPARAAALLRGWGWVLVHLPELWAEREAYGREPLT